MDKRILGSSLLILLMLSAFSLFSQQGEGDADKVTAALGKADAKALALLMNQRVDLELPGSIGIYSRTQAEMILKAFFSKHPNGVFSVKHSGTSAEGALYTIGNYHSGEKDFRVYFLLKKSGDKYLVNQLRFEPES